MKVQRLTTIGAIAIAAMMTLFTNSADARPIHEIRGQVAVIRGHSFALREFLKAKCRVVPNLHSAQALANELACRADALWDVVRRDCYVSPAEIQSRLCGVEQHYRLTNDAVRAAAAWAPRHHLHHACHLLERIDHHLCKVRRVLASWGPVHPIHAQPIHAQPIHVQRPVHQIDPLQFQPHLAPHVGPHVRPHVEPHIRPHVEPHLRTRDTTRFYRPSYGHSPYGVNRAGGVQIRIGGLSFRL